MRNLLAITIVLCMGFSCSACSLFDSPPESDAPLRLYGDFATIAESLSELEEKTGLTIERAGNPDTAYENRRTELLSLLQNDASDVLLLTFEEARFFNEEGYLAGMSAFPQLDDVISNNVFPSLRDLTNGEDGLFGIPFYADPFVIYYNKQWFDNANLAYPDRSWQWEGYSELSARIMDANCADAEPPCYGSVLPYNPYYLSPLIYSFGGMFVDPGNDNSAEGFLNGDATIHAFQWAKRLIAERRISPPVWNWDSDSRGTVLGIQDYQQAFGKNQVGMILESATFYPTFKQALGDRLGLVELPSSADGTHVNAASGIRLLCMPKNGGNPDAALKFIMEIVRSADADADIGTNLGALALSSSRTERTSEERVVLSEIGNMRDLSLSDELYVLSESLMEPLLEGPDEEMRGLLTELAEEYDLARSTADPD
ncbi:ABC transporter substrate-binding protein [Cohnella sp. GCM10027633]|uniref:ABC transporter substrate-binding protein n=1 Tax=unclassified Cohnella TaxID=2636738 RepID=UPI00363CDC02